MYRKQLNEAKKKINKLIQKQEQKQEQKQVQTSNNGSTSGESSASENTQNIIGKENKEYFKKISKSGMLKINNENQQYLEKEYYKCIIYIFSLSIILLENGDANLKISAFKKIQHHLKKIESIDVSKESILKNYIDDLFTNFDSKLILSNYRLYPSTSNKDKINKIELKVKSSKDILNILKSYQKSYQDIINLYNNENLYGSYPQGIFYKINKRKFNLENFDLFSKDLDNISGLEKKGYINYDNTKVLGKGAYAKVYKIKEVDNFVLKILDLSRYKDKTKKDFFVGEYKAIQKSYILSEKCKNSVGIILDYGIVQKPPNELYCIMEKGLLTLSTIREKRNFGLNQKDKIELINLLVKLIIISVEKIKCIHDNNYLHLDVKDENIMIFKGNENNHDIKISDNMTSILNLDTNYIIVKYIDFGFTSEIDGNKIYNRERGIIKNKYKGTGHYLYVNENKSDGKYLYSKYSDLFSLSRILLEIIIKNMDYFNKIDKKRNNKNKKQLPSGIYIKVINDNDIELFFEEIGIKPSNDEKRDLISNIKDILPDKDDNIKCIIEKDKNGNIKKSNKTRLPFIVENCHDVYIENIKKFFNKIVDHLNLIDPNRS